MLVHENTLVLLFFGDYKQAKFITKGDILYTADNSPCVVLGTTEHTSRIYKIEPRDMAPFFVCDGYKLSLFNTFTNSVVNITIGEYMNKNDIWKSKHYLRRNIVTYLNCAAKPINDPYLIGLIIARNKFAPTFIKKYAIDVGEIYEMMEAGALNPAYIFSSVEMRQRLIRGICSKSSTVQMIDSAVQMSARLKRDKFKIPTFESVQCAPVMAVQLQYVAYSLNYMAQIKQERGGCAGTARRRGSGESFAFSDCSSISRRKTGTKVSCDHVSTEDKYVRGLNEDEHSTTSDNYVNDSADPYVDFTTSIKQYVEFVATTTLDHGKFINIEVFGVHNLMNNLCIVL